MSNVTISPIKREFFEKQVSWFYSLTHKIFRKSGIVRRNTIAQNKFWTNVCRLPHSWRKGHCLTPKRCLDWWSNAPFFCVYAKRCFYGLPDDFSFFAVPFAGSGKWMQSVSACLMNETGGHTQPDKPGRMIVAARLDKFRRNGNNHTSFVVVCPFHASGDVFFFQTVSSFYGFSPKVFST